MIRALMRGGLSPGWHGRQGKALSKSKLHFVQVAGSDRIESRQGSLGLPETSSGALWVIQDEQIRTEV
jgi:hypothetical protein